MQQSIRVFGLALVCSLAAASCSDPSPVAPTAIAPYVVPTLAPVISAITPDTGRPDGSTPLRITGNYFQPGAVVTLGGRAAETEVFDRRIIFATAAPHEPGSVDVVVTNPDGQSATLSGAYTYALAPKGPPPTITMISPDAGIAGGGTYVTVAGAGFRRGATVVFGDQLMRGGALDSDNGQFFVKTRAHAVGSVDVIVTNPDGETATLSQGFTFARPESLNFNGWWEGNTGSHWEIPFAFTIENSALISVTCGVPVAISPPVSVATGEFSAVVRNVGSISGKFYSDGYGTGAVNMPGCEETHWEMWKPMRAGS